MSTSFEMHAVVISLPEFGVSAFSGQARLPQYLIHVYVPNSGHSLSVTSIISYDVRLTMRANAINVATSSVLFLHFSNLMCSLYSLLFVRPSPDLTFPLLNLAHTCQQCPALKTRGPRNYVSEEPGRPGQ